MQIWSTKLDFYPFKWVVHIKATYLPFLLKVYNKEHNNMYVGKSRSFLFVNFMSVECRIQIPIQLVSDDTFLIESGGHASSSPSGQVLYRHACATCWSTEGKVYNHQ